MPILYLLRLIDSFRGTVVVIVVNIAILVTITVILTIFVSNPISVAFVSIVHFKTSLSVSINNVASTSSSLIIDTSNRGITAVAVAVDVVPGVVEFIFLHSLGTDPPMFSNIVQEKKIVVTASIIPTEAI